MAYVRVADDVADLEGIPGAGSLPLPPQESPVLTGWDGVVSGRPSGDIVQTTAWGKTKEPLGFETSLIQTRSGDRVLGGAQLLVRRFGRLGAIGYVARGPVILCDEPGAIDLVVNDVEEKARAMGVRHLIIQPGEDGESLDRALLARGYAGGAPDVAPSATIRIDLSASLDEIVKDMPPRQRTRVRASTRRGIEVRSGDRSDIPTFARLLDVTAKRQDFKPVSLDYLYHQWDALKPIDGIKLFMASYEGDPLAAIWLTNFNGTVTYRLTGYSGGEAGRQPVVACHWSAIQWAKEKGFRYYDLGGMDRRYADLKMRGEPLPESFERSPNFFKSRFGGEVVMLPTAKQISFDPLSRLAFKAVYSGLADMKFFRSLVDRMRSG